MMLQCENGIYFYECKTKKNNPFIGKGIISFPLDYTVIDLETTGLNPENELIIEFAAAKVRNGKIVDTFQQLCDPGFPIPPVITGITGISNDMVRLCPNPRSVLPDYLDFIGDDLVVGHNVLFDVRFITRSAEVFKNNYIDTMKIFRKLHPSLPHHRLSDMVDFYNQCNESAHRALSDCYATQGCFEAMRAECIQFHGCENNFLSSLK
ncbi:MAG: 3'-5' exonuclease [Clostridia bacterium]|nr:3'-5' exonuclease [Clostridia bacterium]